MTVVNEISGRYQSYIVNGDLDDDLVGDWINVPANARTIDFYAKWPATGTPDGTITIEASDVREATAADIVAPAGSITVTVGGDNGEINLPVVKRMFYRAIFTHANDGAVETLQMSARVGL